MDFDPLVTHFKTGADEALFYSGGQLAVYVDGQQVCCVCVGKNQYGTSISPHDVSALYCAAKPLVTMLTLELEAQGQLTLDGSIASYLDLPANHHLASVRLKDLLRHKAWIGGEDGMLFRMTPRAKRGSQALGVTQSQAHEGTQYNEFVAWFLLGRCIENITGTSLQPWLESRDWWDSAWSGELLLKCSSDSVESVANRMFVRWDDTGEPKIGEF